MSTNASRILFGGFVLLAWAACSPQKPASSSTNIGEQPLGSAERPLGWLGPPEPISIPGDSTPQPPSFDVPEATLLPNVLVNDKVNDAPDQSQSETTIAVDPTNADRLIGGFNDCRGFFFPSRNGISGWGFSVDGGNSWTGIQTGLPKANPADFGTRGDPSVDVDSDGNFYYASLYTRAGSGLFHVSVHKGHFEGTTFVWNTPTFATTNTNTDKEHVGVDKRPGSQTVYVSYTNFNVGNGQVEVVRSTDGGATWSAPVVIAPGSGVVHQGSLPRVGPDGEIYVAWEDGSFQPTRSIHIRKSTAWPTFGPDVTVSSVTPTGNPPNNSRINEFPTMDVDRTNRADRGRVYVAWNDGRFGGGAGIGAILLSQSADGVTWSAPIQVNDDGLPSATGTHHWFPWLSVDRRGVANVGFYDRRLRIPDTQLTDVFAAQFTVAGGVKPNVRITNQSFSMAVPSRCTPNFGDYNGAATGTANFYFIWGDGRLENPDAFAGGVTIIPIFAAPSSVEACRSTGTTATITVLGGAGFFQNDVTLSLLSVNPPESTITANFDPNPVPAPPPQGRTSAMGINTTGATPPGIYTLTVQGTDGNLTETTEVRLTVTAQPPGVPEQITPLDGEVDVSPRPTLSWTAPFDGGSRRPAPPNSASGFIDDQTRNLFATALPNRADQLNPLGTVRYHVQIASDRDFTTIVTEADTTSTTFTVPVNLDLGANYYWRVNASNACGTSQYSPVRSFVVGACFGGFASVAAYPQPGILWQAATVFNGKVYSFGGSNTLAFPIPAITNSYVYNPLADTWTAIAPLPGPRLLMNAAEVNGKIYIAGGGTTALFSDRTNTMFEYDVATDTWATKAPLPERRVGAAMAGFGGKVYIFGGFVDDFGGITNSVLEFDPVANTYISKANMATARARSHAGVVAGKIYVIGGQGGTGRNNEAFDPVANTWAGKAPALWGLAFDMGTTALGRKIYVFGRDTSEGPPTATQAYDTAADTWAQFTPLQRAANNNQAVTVGSGLYIIGGFDGAVGAIHNVVQRFKNCDGASGMISFVADGDGSVPDVANERCDLIISNDLSATVASALVIFNTPDGKADSSRAFSLAPGELASLTNIIRQVRGAEGVQNVKGSIAVLATEPIDALVSITNNATNDGTILDRQSLTGTPNGFVPRIQLNATFRTQVVITNAFGRTANVQLLAYPPEGGDTPLASTSVSVPPHGLRDFPDMVSALGLSSGYFGQLSWNSTQPVSVFARDVTSDNGFSGTAPAHSVTDGGKTLLVAYVEDTTAFSSNLQLNNNGAFTAVSTVRFIDVADPTGGTPGTSSSRDIAVRVNSATAIPNVIRWALRSDSTEPLGKRGFLEITSPQIITALASIVNNTSFDPAITDTEVTRGSSFTPIIVKLEAPAGSSRVAIANPGSTAANVDLMPFNPAGTPALDAPVRIPVVGGAQFFTDDIVGFLGLPPIFLGSMTINANVPVLIFNQERTESNTGFVVPVHSR